MNHETPVDALKRAIESAGGQSAFAAKLPVNEGCEPVSAARVWNWVNRDKKAPAEVCPDIEALTGVTCEQLRPGVNWAQLRQKHHVKTPKIPSAEVANERRKVDLEAAGADGLRLVGRRSTDKA